MVADPVAWLSYPSLRKSLIMMAVRMFESTITEVI